MELVHEAAVGVLAPLDVIDAAVDRLPGHVEPRVSGRPQGHHLADGHREVGVVPLGQVSPAALLVLGVDDQLDGLAELFPELRPPRHAVALGQKERGKPVAVHGPVTGGRRIVDEAAPLRVGQQVVHTSADLLAVGPSSRRAAVGHERQPGQGADGHVAAVVGGAERAVVVLPRGEELQSPVNGPVGRGRDQLGGGLFRIGLLTGRSAGQPRGRQGGHQGQPACSKNG